MKRIKIIFAVLLILCGALCAYIYAVYHGYVLLNNPSGARYPVRGVDVSHYQGNIDWEILSKNDIQFAYIKATEGSSHIDGKFNENWEHAKKTSLKTGAYHFFSFDSPGSTQAEHVISTVEAFDGMLPLVVDVEYYGDKKVNMPEIEGVRQELNILLEALEQHYGTTPVIYSTEEVFERYLKGSYDKYPLWIRSVFTKPQKDADWTFWQYTNRERLPGYTGQETFIDMNVFHGDIEKWNEFCTAD